MKTRLANVQSFVTKDGSIIRELMHPQRHADCQQQSLAQAVIPAHTTTLLHKHVCSEEFYHILAGEGSMVLGAERFPVEQGDTLCIPPGTPHQITNVGDKDLVLLCCCAPPYADEDTELLGSE